MPRPPRSNGKETREKILDVALEMFIDQGYDKTSLRDIAERVGITKAALYYYFERKEEILLELHLQFHSLGTELLDEIERIPDGPERVKAWPGMIGQLIDGFSSGHDLLVLHRRNQSALRSLHDNERNRLENEELEARMAKLLSTRAISLSDRVRMAAAVGIFTEVLVESSGAFTDVSHEDLADQIRELVQQLFEHTSDRA